MIKVLKTQWIKKNLTKKEIFLVVAGAVIPITAITLLLVFRSNIYSREHKLRELWKTQIVDRYKIRQSNESALRLQELTSTLGINLVPAGLIGVRPTQESMNELKELNKKITAYLKHELSKEDPSIEPLPEPVLQFYCAKKSSIDEIVTYLNTHPDPEWAMDVSKVVAP
jgi:predicted membrane chloride channel (bestrophin family)